MSIRKEAPVVPLQLPEYPQIDCCGWIAGHWFEGPGLIAKTLADATHWDWAFIEKEGMYGGLYPQKYFPF